MTKQNSKWFQDAHHPMMDMASIVMQMDSEGRVSDDMREAILNHAQNAISSLPQSIAALSCAIASAQAGDVGLDTMQAANASWGVASLADSLAAMTALRDHFTAPALT